MEYNRSIVISIAGFDPTGGAGVLADIKTIEQHNCLGFGVLTSTTIQTEREVFAVNWLSESEIINQLKPLLEHYTIKAVKIGIVNQLSTLKAICERIKAKDKTISIVWDPVLSATSGVPFLEGITRDELHECLGLIDLVTPNAIEILELSGCSNEEEGAKLMSQVTSVLVKGGHSIASPGTDILYTKEKVVGIHSNVNEYFDKHGTGCILSSAITSNIAKGNSLEQSCRNAKNYLETTANSNPQRLAYHVQ